MTKYSNQTSLPVLPRQFKAFLILLLAGCFTAFQLNPQPKLKLLVFEGSDWCANCWRLEKNILSDSAFVQQITEMGISIERIDFPQRKKLPDDVQRHNDSVAAEYDFDGSFPTLLLARADTFLFQKISFSNQGPEEFLQELAAKKNALE